MPASFSDAQLDKVLAFAGVVLPPKIHRIRQRDQRETLELRVLRTRAILRHDLLASRMIIAQFIRDPIIGEGGRLHLVGADHVRLLRQAGYERLADQIEHLLRTQVSPPWTVRRLGGEVLTRSYEEISGKRATSYMDAKIGAVPFVQAALALLGIKRTRSAVKEMILAARRPRRPSPKRPNRKGTKRKRPNPKGTKRKRTKR
jgi:hypothetical protein